MTLSISSLDAVPVGLELMEELVATRLFVALTNGSSSVAQTVERAEKAAIGLVNPPYVTRSAPTGLPESIEPSVVSDPETRVRLGVVTRQLTETSPRVEEARPMGHHLGHPITARRHGTRERVLQRRARILGLGIQDRFRESLGRKHDRLMWLVAHRE